MGERPVVFGRGGGACQGCARVGWSCSAELWLVARPGGLGGACPPSPYDAGCVRGGQTVAPACQWRWLKRHDPHRHWTSNIAVIGLPFTRKFLCKIPLSLITRSCPVLFPKSLVLGAWYQIQQLVSPANWRLVTAICFRRGSRCLIHGTRAPRAWYVVACVLYSSPGFPAQGGRYQATQMRWR